MAPLWFLVGVLLGSVNAYLVYVFVDRLQPSQSARMRRRAIIGYLLRLAIAGSLLALAIQQSLGAGLAVAGGLWVARWLLVYVGAAGKVRWTTPG